jgi:hypothetical protein
MKSMALKSARELYRLTAEVGEVAPTFAGREGVAWSAQRIPTAISLGSLDRE